jgi:hypothetical protein
MPVPLLLVSPILHEAPPAHPFLTPPCVASVVRQVIALHEAYPGHYQQSLIAQSHPRPLRRLHVCPHFYEGWGLYCEQLGHEAHFYSQVKLFVCVGG